MQEKGLKLSLFANNIILYKEDPQGVYKTVWDLSTFSEVSEYRNNKRKQQVYCTLIKNILRKNSKKATSLIIAFKTYKKFGINVTKSKTSAVKPTK